MGASEEESVRSCKDLVDYLLKYPFSGLSYDDKVFVKEKAVPRPDLSLSLIKNSRSFQNSWYERAQWLTGSSERKALFCWPCMLFGINVENTSTWTKSGYTDLKNLSRSITKHNDSKQHISCALKLHSFGKVNIATLIDSVRELEIKSFNETVRKNREIIKRLIDICMFLCTQELAFRGHDETNDSLNRGNFKELVTLISKRDEILQEFLKSNSVFSGTSKTIQNDLLDSITFVLNKNIAEEIENSKFFSWQVDETTDISCVSQLSVIFRFVKKGAVIERFLGFFDVSTGRTAEDLFQLLNTTFGKFDLKKKLVAQTYDGAAVMAGHLNGLQAKVKSVAPQALFTHCYAHSLNLVLSKACSSISQVRIFFSNLTGFSSYFSKSTKRTEVLNRICHRRLPTTAPTRWNFTSRVVSTVYSKQSELIEVFDSIINDASFDSISIREAVALKRHLQDGTFGFFLKTFNLLFEQTDVIFSILQNKFTDVVYSKSRLQALKSKLTEFRKNESYFNDIFGSVSLEQVESKRRKVSDILHVEQRYRQLYNEIIDTILGQLDDRFADLFSLNFFDLLNVSKFEAFSEDFPEERFKTLIAQYGNQFNEARLRNELSVLYSDKIFGNSQTPLEMLKFVEDHDLEVCVPDLFNFVCLVVTIPVTSASVERSFSALKRIKNFARNTIGQPRLNNMSAIALEKELTKDLSSKDDKFYEDVIDYFAEQKNRRIPLVYKKL